MKRSLGQRVADARRAQGRALSDVASATGYSTSFISDVEHDRRTLSLGAASRLARVLDLGEQEFLTERLQTWLDEEELPFTVALTPRKHGST